MIDVKEVIVVEGKSDKQFLETFINADFLLCNGSAIDGFDMDYLKMLAETRGVIILTDPDYPGQRIRNEISKELPICKHAFVRKEVSIKHHKVGVAESTQEEVISALKNVVTFNKFERGNITLTDLVELKIAGEQSKENKKKIIDFFHIGYCNSKTMIKRLNLLNIDRKELEKVIYDSNKKICG